MKDKNLDKPYEECKFDGKNLIFIEKINNHHYNVFFYNGKFIGEFLKEVDGYFVYYPIENGGGWESAPLKQIADKLDELNEPWDKEIDEFFSGYGKIVKVDHKCKYESDGEGCTICGKTASETIT